MADLKISALTGASTPLAGTEVLPIVQSGSTVKVSVANLTAGRAVATAGGSFTDNITQSTAGKGINFTANTNAPGMTSELLNWYEEGTWTPTVIGTTTAGTCTYNTRSGTYTRIGRIVYYQLELFYTGHTGTGNMQITGLPFTVGASSTAIANPSGLVFPNNLVIVAFAGGTALIPYTYASDAARAFLAIDDAAILTVSGTYSV